jgi:hypothetical protein
MAHASRLSPERARGVLQLARGLTAAPRHPTRYPRAVVEALDREAPEAEPLAHLQ